MELLIMHILSNIKKECEISVSHGGDYEVRMEAVRTSEKSVHFNVTARRYIPEDSKLQ
jgi:hypothetical protein